MPRKPKTPALPTLHPGADFADAGIALIGVKARPAGLDAIRSAATEAHAYPNLVPYLLPEVLLSQAQIQLFATPLPCHLNDEDQSTDF